MEEIEQSPSVVEPSISPDTPLIPSATIHKEIPQLSVLRMAALTISFLGVQFGWAVQIAFTSPLFL